MMRGEFVNSSGFAIYCTVANVRRPVGDFKHCPLSWMVQSIDFFVEWIVTLGSVWFLIEGGVGLRVESIAVSGCPDARLP